MITIKKDIKLHYSSRRDDYTCKGEIYISSDTDIYITSISLTSKIWKCVVEFDNNYDRIGWKEESENCCKLNLSDIYGSENGIISMGKYDTLRIILRVSNLCDISVGYITLESIMNKSEIHTEKMSNQGK